MNDFGVVGRSRILGMGCVLVVYYCNRLWRLGRICLRALGRDRGVLGSLSFGFV